MKATLVRGDRTLGHTYRCQRCGIERSCNMGHGRRRPTHCQDCRWIVAHEAGRAA